MCEKRRALFLKQPNVSNAHMPTAEKVELLARLDGRCIPLDGTSQPFVTVCFFG